MFLSPLEICLWINTFLFNIYFYFFFFRHSYWKLKLGMGSWCTPTTRCRSPLRSVLRRGAILSLFDKAALPFDHHLGNEWHASTLPEPILHQIITILMGTIFRHPFTLLSHAPKLVMSHGQNFLTQVGSIFDASVGSDRAGSATSESGKFLPKSYFFNFFPSGQKKSCQVRSKNTQVKGTLICCWSKVCYGWVGSGPDLYLKHWISHKLRSLDLLAPWCWTKVSLDDQGLDLIMSLKGQASFGGVVHCCVLASGWLSLPEEVMSILKKMRFLQFATLKILDTSSFTHQSLMTMMLWLKKLRHFSYLLKKTIIPPIKKK